jgi:uncharacterized membrane protein
MLLFALPAIGRLIKPPQTEGFSELYILGPNRLLEDIPFNIKTGEEYSIYLGVRNRLGTSAYYTCIVKLGDENIVFPNNTLGTPSTLPALYEYKFIISSGEAWEAPLSFQANNFTVTENTSALSSITLNGLEFPINKQSLWNSNKTGFIYYIVIELWFFDQEMHTTNYHNRSVHLMLNVTA